MVGRLPLRPLRKKVTANSIAYSIDRQTTEDESTYGSGKTYSQNTITADLYLFAASKEPTITESGEAIRGSLSGLCHTDADIEVGDRLTHGDARYELEVKSGVPNEHNPSLYKLRFQRL